MSWYSCEHLHMLREIFKEWERQEYQDEQDKNLGQYSKESSIPKETQQQLPEGRSLWDVPHYNDLIKG